MGVGAGLYMYFVVVQKFTFAISSPDEFLFRYANRQTDTQTETYRHALRNRRVWSTVMGEVIIIPVLHKTRRL